jgi:hypothetical protein
VKSFLHLTDVNPVLAADVVDRARPVVKIKRLAMPRRVRRSDGSAFTGVRTWQEVAQRVLVKQFPKAWIYRGGRHVAVHASAPDRKTNEAGACLFRIIEISSPRDATVEQAA